jgi:membrane protein DedA with SNARE-associated domain
MPSDTIPGVAGLSGYPLIAAICCLLLVEEVGVPLPFGPGDLLLVVAGAAMVSGRLNPLAVVLAAYVAPLSGAIGGRELFSRVGGRALARIARLLRCELQVDRLGARLYRGGARAVFLGRITPGLRVMTTQVCGLSGMPRRTFLMGLAPAVAVYEAFFLGIGATFGPGALSMIHRHMPSPWQLVAVIVAIIAGWWLHTRLRERGKFGPAAPRESASL